MLWRNAWWIVKHDLKRVKAGLFWSFVMNLYFSFFGGIMARRILQADDWNGFDQFMADVIFLTCMSCLGFILTREYRNYWRNDVFTKRMLFMRTLPISAKELVTARFTLMGISLAVTSAIFFIPFYFIAAISRALSLLQFMGLVFVWISYGALMGALYISVEMLASGKTYLAVSTIGAFAYLGIAGLGWLFGFGIFSSSLEMVRSGGAILPAVSVIFAVTGVFGIMRVVEKRILTREFGRV